MRNLRFGSRNQRVLFLTLASCSPLSTLLPAECFIIYAVANFVATAVANALAKGVANGGENGAANGGQKMV